MSDSRNNTTRKRWPQVLGPDDNLMAFVDSETDTVIDLVLSSVEKRGTFIRERGSWFPLGRNGIEKYDDPDIYTEFVEPEFIDYFDGQNRRTPGEVPFGGFDAYASQQEEDLDTVIAAVAAPACPPATQDVVINLKNRKKAMVGANYGPLDPNLPNDSYWEQRAANWSVTVEEARQSTCGNCAVFFVTSSVKECIASGLSAGDGGSRAVDAWDAVDAGELGYCEAFDFKCAASRTCDAWVAGGPVSDESDKENGLS